MSRLSTLNPSAARLRSQEPANFSRKNYWVFVAEGGLFMSGMAFVSQDTILPGIVRELGGSNTVLAFIPMLLMMGMALPPLLSAGWIERQGRLLPLLRVFAFLQRLPYLLAALALLGLGSEHPRIALWSVLACPVLSGLMGGITFSAWLRITARTVAGNRRASGSALRNLIAAVMGIFAGVASERILTHLPGLPGFALLHGICFGFLMFSYAIFLRTEEPHAEAPPRRAHHSFVGQLRVMGHALRVDLPFRHYIESNVLAATVFATVPFMAVTALDVTGRQEAFTGRLLAFQMAGAIVGNLVGGWVGDLRGSRRLLLYSRGSFIVMCGVFMSGQSAWMFCLAFALWGFTFALQKIGQQTFLTEHAFGKPLPSYVAVFSVLQLIAVLSVGVISSSLRAWVDAMWPVVLVSFAGVLVSAWILWRRVPDSRFAGKETFV